MLTSVRQATHGLLTSALNMSAAPVAAAVNKMVPQPDATSDIPVVLVHGCFASPLHMMAGVHAMRSAGWSNVSTHGYVAQIGDIESLSLALSAHVRDVADRTGRGCHVVGWSLGGLLGRWSAEMQGLGASGEIVSLSTLSTPHKGTPVARLSRLAGPFASQVMHDMIPGSPALTSLAATTGSPVAYNTVGSVHDCVVTDASASIDGHPHMTLSGVSHLGIVTSTKAWKHLTTVLAS